jgi:acyl-CoA reductase-like NAD-dependent aldehyde dehydrogenase
MVATNLNINNPQPVRPQPSSREELDSALEELSANSQIWVDLPLAERISIVEEVHQAFPKVWQRWVDSAVSAKGIAHRKLGNDREWLELATISRLHTNVLRALKDIEASGAPKFPGGYKVKPNGQVVAQVYPDSMLHSLAFRGVRIEVWLKPEVSLEEAHSKQAWAYKQAPHRGKVALVLGAGNASSLPPSDICHKLFHDLCAVILKMNPVNAYIGPLLEEVYSPLIDRGFLRIVYGAAEEGTYLVHHDLVDEVHMTGSDRTFEAIVFGPGEEGRGRKATGKPLVTKPVKGELGCITPWIIVPGDWSEADIKEQAAKMAFWMMRHEGYICFAPRILILHEEWPHRAAFLQALIDSLSKVEPIKAYYPGSAETQNTFVKAHPEAIQLGEGSDDHVPWTVIPDLDPTVSDDICFRRESFSGLCGEVILSAPSVPEFLSEAVDFLNNTVWGTLSATLVVSEQSLSDPQIGSAVEEAIGDLRYGTVALNGPGTWGFYHMKAPWGGYPGSDINDIQSGNSFVANFLMLYEPEKTVVRAPFRMRPYPFLGTAKDLHVFSQRLAEFEVKPDLLKLTSLFWSALRT